MISLCTLMGQGGMGIENDGEKTLKKKKKERRQTENNGDHCLQGRREIKEKWRERRSDKGFKV